MTTALTIIVFVVMMCLSFYCGVKGTGYIIGRKICSAIDELNVDDDVKLHVLETLMKAIFEK